MSAITSRRPTHSPPSRSPRAPSRATPRPTASEDRQRPDELGGEAERLGDPAAAGARGAPLNFYAMPVDYLPFWEVSKFDRSGRVLLDSGRDIGASLRLRESSLN